MLPVDVTSMSRGEDDAAPGGEFQPRTESSRLVGDDPPIDLDVLRGWKERRDPTLREEHRLPAVAELVQLGDGDRPEYRYSIHGADLLLGRYQSRYAPVDVLLHRLRDHQTYQLGAPHVHLGREDDHWQIRVLSPRTTTTVDDSALDHYDDPVELTDGTVVTLGNTRFRFRTTGVSLPEWRQARQQLLSEVDEPALFLKRRGGPCGPFCRLDEQTPLVIGRTHPRPGLLPDTDHWPDPDELNWDLSGLYDFERKHVAFRHAVVELNSGRWTLRALSTRQRTFVNRIAATGTVALKTGDEIGLGSVLVRFHHPHRSLESSRPRHVPAVVDWSEGKPPSTPSADELSEPDDPQED